MPVQFDTILAMCSSGHVFVQETAVFLQIGEFLVFGFECFLQSGMVP
jgi:hypothetical protein